MKGEGKADMGFLASARIAAWGQMVLFALLVSGIYHTTVSWLVTHDWVREDYSSAVLIPVIVGYLVWEKRGRLALHPSVPTWKALVPLAAALALFWVGELAGEFFTLYISLWLTLASLCWMYLGWAKLRLVVFPLLFSLTMFPLPNFLFNRVSVELKMMSSRLGVAAMQLYGLSAYREGNVIDVGFTQLQVVDACSGLRYLIPLIVLSILLAYYFRAPLWKKVFLVFSAVPVSIVTNGLRIASVGILYEFWGPAAAEGFFHDFSGWFIFLCSLGLLLAEMWLLKRLPPPGRTAGAPACPDIEPPVVAPGLRPGLPPALFAVTVALLGGTLALAQGVGFRERVPIRKSFADFPLRVAGWSGERKDMASEYARALEFSDYVIVDYRDRDGREVNFYTAYYETQRKGGSIHSPATCLPGSGWEFTDSGIATIPPDGASEKPMRVMRAFMRKGGVSQLIYYWFPQRGRVVTGTYELKLFTFWDALTRHRTDGALVRVITPLYPNENTGDAENRLRSFARSISPVLEGYLPGRDLP
jgi:exosortase D (VPLPA-CTERM-specific)